MAAIGATIRRSGIRIDRVYVTDSRNLTANRSYNGYSFDGQLAATLQSQVESHKLTLNQAYVKLLGYVRTCVVSSDHKSFTCK